MSKSVSGELKEDPAKAVERVRQLADEHNIEFSGDECRGAAHGKGFHIEYLIEGQHCTLTVKKKPMLVPWAVVEKSLAKVFK